MDYADLEALLRKWDIDINLSNLDFVFFKREVIEFLERIDTYAAERGYETGFEDGKEEFYDHDYECCSCHS